MCMIDEFKQRKRGGIDYSDSSSQLKSISNFIIGGSRPSSSNPGAEPRCQLTFTENSGYSEQCFCYLRYCYDRRNTFYSCILTIIL